MTNKFKQGDRVYILDPDWSNIRDQAGAMVEQVTAFPYPYRVSYWDPYIGEVKITYFEEHELEERK